MSWGFSHGGLTAAASQRFGRGEINERMMGFISLTIVWEELLSTSINYIVYTYILYYSITLIYIYMPLFFNGYISWYIGYIYIADYYSEIEL